jgi:hypothetical protein
VSRPSRAACCLWCSRAGSGCSCSRVYNRDFNTVLNSTSNPPLYAARRAGPPSTMLQSRAPAYLRRAARAQCGGRCRRLGGARAGSCSGCCSRRAAAASVHRHVYVDRKSTRTARRVSVYVDKRLGISRDHVTTSLSVTIHLPEGWCTIL